MASGEEMEDEVSSLFEGMVLFTPSQMEYEDHHDPTPPPADAASAPSSSSSLSQPLDENIFSDLTLITPLPVKLDSSLPPAISDAAATTTNSTRSAKVEFPSILRQTSRKKKKASIRIGYGRDTPLADADDHPHQLSPLPSIAQSELNVSDLSVPSLTSHCEAKSSVAESTQSPPSTVAAPETKLSDNGTLDHIDSSYSAAMEDDPLAPPTVPAVLSKSFREEGGEEASIPIEAKFEQIRRLIAEKLEHAREVAASISATRKETTKRRRKAAENVNLASIKYRELEKELEEACEAEDFEMAERLSESLATSEKEKEKFVSALRDAESECDLVDSRMQKVLEWQIAAEEEFVSLLESFALDAAKDGDLVLENAKMLSSKEMDQWLSSTESLEANKLELEIESLLMRQAGLVLNDSIAQSTENDRKEKKTLIKKKDVLADELERLLALVKAKEAEIAENDANIKAIEEKITDVVAGFQEVQSSIENKYINLQCRLSQMQSESQALLTKKNEIDDRLSKEEERVGKVRELAKVSADEAKSYKEVVGLRKSLVFSILKSREDKVRLAKTEEKLSEDVHFLKQEVSLARGSLQELSSRKSCIQQEMATSKQTIFYMDKRVPELEAEKKVAAAARNFKEAARIATESKTLFAEKERIQSKLEEDSIELGKLEEEIKNNVAKLQESEVLIISKEKEVAMARYQRLLLVVGAATAERSAALELGDLEEAGILLAEAEEAAAEAKKLQPVDNFQEDEFTNLPKHFICMELISNLGGKQLAELAASADLRAL